MAKKSMIARKTSAVTVAKYAEKRAALKAILNDAGASDDESGMHRSSSKLPEMRAPFVSNVAAA